MVERGQLERLKVFGMGRLKAHRDPWKMNQTEEIYRKSWIILTKCDHIFIN